MSVRGDTGLRLLLVEDNDDDAASIQRTLGDAGHELEVQRVGSASSFDGALAEPWDLIIAAHGQPSFDALAAVVRLRARGLDVPCIIVSSDGDEGTAVAYMRAGATDFVSKANLKRLAPALESALERRASESSFHAAVEQMPAAVVVHRGGSLLYANQAAAGLYGYAAAADLVGQPVSSLLVEGDVRAEERMRLILETGATAPWREHRVLRRDGTLADVEVSGTRVLFGGRPAILALLRDVSESRALTAKTMQIDRMICAGTLAAGVGHEINNPLAYVTSNLEWLTERLRAMRGLATDDEIYSVIADCQTGARRIRDIVRGLQTFARAEDTSAGPIDVRPIIDSAISMASNEVSGRTTVRCEHEAVALVHASESSLGQVLLNLVVNAAQAIRDGTRSDNEIVIRTRSDERHVILSVSDTGIGIESTALPRIFDPFFTTKAFGTGTGLGLAICRDIVNGLGGEISVESVRGEGATFIVRLPRSSTVAASKAPQEPRSEGPVLRRRVLVVDDEERLGAVFERMIGDEHDVVFLGEGRAAKDLLDRGEDFDVVFLDLMMPDVSGMDLYAHLEATRPSMIPKVVIMTGGAYTRSARELVDRLATPPLPKPIDWNALRDWIAALPT